MLAWRARATGASSHGPEQQRERSLQLRTRRRCEALKCEPQVGVGWRDERGHVLQCLTWVREIDSRSLPLGDFHIQIPGCLRQYSSADAPLVGAALLGATHQGIGDLGLEFGETRMIETVRHG